MGVERGPGGKVPKKIATAETADTKKPRGAGLATQGFSRRLYQVISTLAVSRDSFAAQTGKRVGKP
jgi:hypothetical protein